MTTIVTSGYARTATRYMYHGQITVGTSAQQITSSDIRLMRGLLIKADNDNSGNVYVGNSSSVTTSNGFRLAAGEGIEVEIDNANKIYVIADASNQKIHVVGV